MNRFLKMACSFSVLLANQASAQITYDGCRDVNSVPVVSVVQYDINDVAMATIANGQPTVFYNPRVLARINPKTRQFFYAHECAHHALGHVMGPTFPLAMEQEADCWGIKTLYESGSLSENDLATIVADIARFGVSDWSHLPGPQRAINMYVCLGLPDHRQTSAITGYVENLESAGYKGPIDAFLIMDAECLENHERGPNIQWIESPNPIVRYLLSFKNICEQGGVDIILIVLSGQVPRGDERDVYSEFEVYKTQRHSFSLSAQESKVVSDSLTWTRRQETMPRLRTLLYYKIVR